MFLFKNHAENEVKASDLQLSSIYFDSPQIGTHQKANCIKL